MESRNYKHYILVMWLATVAYPLFKIITYFSYGPIESWFSRSPTLIIGLMGLIGSKFYKEIKDNLAKVFLIVSLVTTGEFLYFLVKFFGTPYGNYYYTGSFILTIGFLLSFKNKRDFLTYLGFNTVTYLIYLFLAFKKIGDHFTVELFNQLGFFSFATVIVSLQVWHNFRSDEELVKAKKELDEKQIQLVNSSKLASLGEMAGGIAHEINNPLQIISGSVELLEIKPNSPEALENIRDTVARINKIVEGLRLFSRDGESTSYEPTKISEVLEETLSLCLERFKKHGISLSTEVSESVYINCNHIEISRVFLNLLNNAFDAIVEHGEEKAIRITSEFFTDKVQIKFFDSGKPISKELSEKIFQPFFTTKDIGKGTGLGLSISQGVVEKHGGKMFIELDPKCFVVELPTNGV